METKTDVIVEPTTTLSNDNGDHDRFSHYARKVDIARSAVKGTPCIALCGKVWVPPYADGTKFPVCPDCKAIYDTIKEW